LTASGRPPQRRPDPTGTAPDPTADRPDGVRTAAGQTAVVRSETTMAAVAAALRDPACPDARSGSRRPCRRERRPVDGGTSGRKLWTSKPARVRGQQTAAGPWWPGGGDAVGAPGRLSGQRMRSRVTVRIRSKRCAVDMVTLSLVAERSPAPSADSVSSIWVMTQPERTSHLTDRHGRSPDTPIYSPLNHHSACCD
jgi:hypothetical protein